MILKTGSFYAIRYTGAKTTLRPSLAFILYSGSIGNKVHCLYLEPGPNGNGVPKMDLLKFLAVIKQLQRTGKKYDGRLLYRILRTYVPGFIRASYRTLWIGLVNQASLMSYGLNNESDFSDLEKAMQNKSLYQVKKSTYMNTFLGFYVGKKAGDSFYQPASAAEKKTNVTPVKVVPPAPSIAPPPPKTGSNSVVPPVNKPGFYNPSSSSASKKADDLYGK